VRRYILSSSADRVGWRNHSLHGQVLPDRSAPLCPAGHLPLMGRRSHMKIPLTVSGFARATSPPLRGGEERAPSIAAAVPRPRLRGRGADPELVEGEAVRGHFIISIIALEKTVHPPAESGRAAQWVPALPAVGRDDGGSVGACHPLTVSGFARATSPPLRGGEEGAPSKASFAVATPGFRRLAISKNWKAGRVVRTTQIFYRRGSTRPAGGCPDLGRSLRPFLLPGCTQ